MSILELIFYFKWFQYKEENLLFLYRTEELIKMDKLSAFTEGVFHK